MNPNNLALVTDFRDYYDHHFGHTMSKNAALSRMVPALYRLADDGFSRYAAMKYMNNIGLQTPLFTYSTTELDDLLQIGPVVVYHDLMAHRGEGKFLLKPGQPWPPAGWPERVRAPKMAMQWIDTGRMPISHRQLFIGEERFSLTYQSDDYWRSNCGNVMIGVGNPRNKLPEPAEQRYPLMAIDYVYDKASGQYLAIDFNTAPQLRGTPIEDRLEAKRVATWIAEWIDQDRTATRVRGKSS